MSLARFLSHPAMPAAHRPTGKRAALPLAVMMPRLVWLLVLLVVVQSLMVQAHAIAHLPPPALPASALSSHASAQAASQEDYSPRAATLLTHRHQGDDDDPAQCPLCREEALSGHYLAPAPFEFAPPPPDHFAPQPVLRPVGTAQAARTRSRIRGPPSPLQT